MQRKIKNAICKTVSICGLSTMLSVSAYANDWNTIVIGSEGAYPPFNYFNSKGELVGFDIDIGKALCDNMQAKCRFVSQDWDGMIPALLSGKYDVILASMFITNERRKIVDFTDPYYLAAMTFVAPKDAIPKDFSTETISQLSVGALGSSTEAEYMEKAYPDADIRLYRSQDELKLDMTNGRIDLIIGDLLPLLEWTSKEKDGSCCTLTGEIITDSQYVGDGVGMAIRKEDSQLKDKINQALYNITVNGTYQAINEKYFDIDIYNMK